MNASHSPPPQGERSPRQQNAGWPVVVGLALLPILYVASFVYLNLDAKYQWGIVHSLDQRTLEFVRTFYMPLIWICDQALKIVGASP